MIRDLASATAFLDRRLGGVGARPLSLLRIVAWAVIGLLVVGWMHPAPTPALADNQYNRVLRNPDVRVVTVDKNDPRGFRTTKDPGAFTIAWIGASENQSISKKRYTFVPAEVQKLLPKLDGQRVVVDMYFMSGARTIDVYAAAQAAMRSDADMIVVSANPVWLFNQVAVQEWTNLNGNTFVNAATDPRSWPLLAGFETPQDVALGLAGRAIPALANRWWYSEKLRERIAAASPLDTSAKLPKNPAPSALDKVKAMRLPLEFWNLYRPPIDPSASVAARQAALLEQSKVDGSGLNDIVVDELLRDLAEWGKPVLVYVPPIAPDSQADPTIDRKLAAIEAHLAEIAARHPSDTLTVLPTSLGRTLKMTQSQFNDILHLRDVGPVAEYLAAQICTELVEQGTATTCTPKEATP